MSFLILGAISSSELSLLAIRRGSASMASQSFADCFRNILDGSSLASNEIFNCIVVYILHTYQWIETQLQVMLLSLCLWKDLKLFKHQMKMITSRASNRPDNTYPLNICFNSFQWYTIFYSFNSTWTVIYRYCYKCRGKRWRRLSTKLVHIIF